MLVAYHRAIESRRADALFRDPIAERLSAGRGGQIARRLPRGRRVAWTTIVRTVVLDDDNAISWISSRAVAQFAVKSLETPAAHNATLELGGPEALTPHQVVGIYETASGRAIEMEHVPAAALEEQQRGATDPMMQSFVAVRPGKQDAEGGRGRRAAASSDRSGSTCRICRRGSDSTPRRKAGPRGGR